MNKELTPLDVSKQLKDFVIKFVKNGLDRTFIHGSFDIIENELKKTVVLSNQLEHERKIRIRQEKKLKALEIIKEYISIGDNRQLRHKNLWNMPQENFDLLKEVLK